MATVVFHETKRQEAINASTENNILSDNFDTHVLEGEELTSSAIHSVFHSTSYYKANNKLQSVWQFRYIDAEYPELVESGRSSWKAEAYYVAKRNNSWKASSFFPECLGKVQIRYLVTEAYKNFRIRGMSDLDVQRYRRTHACHWAGSVDVPVDYGLTQYTNMWIGG